MKKNISQLRAISYSYTAKANYEAYTRMFDWYSNHFNCSEKDFDKFLSSCKDSFSLKSDSYVVLEKCLSSRKAIYYD